MKLIIVLDCYVMALPCLWGIGEARYAASEEAVNTGMKTHQEIHQFELTF